MAQPSSRGRAHIAVKGGMSYFKLERSNSSPSMNSTIHINTSDTLDQAQRLLNHINWTYYTVWRDATTPNLPGLSWSWGGVNELLLAHNECRNMGLLLQEFYQHCAFLPLGFGVLAGEAFESGQYRWASGEELLLQIRFLSIQNQQTPPPELRSLYFKAVVYIPLEKGAGVLEIGTKDLVPKSESMLYQILGLINGLGNQGTSRGEQILHSSPEAGTKALPSDVGNQYWDVDEQDKSASMVENSGGTAIFGQSSNTSSYWSSTSTTSSSTSFGSDQMGNNSNTTFALDRSPAQVSSMNIEDMLMSPASSLYAPMVNSFDELHIPNQLEHIDIHGINAPISLPDLDIDGVSNAELIHCFHDHHLHVSQLPLKFTSTNVPVPPPLLSRPDNAHDNPMQCGFIARNDGHVDAHHHCVNEIVGPGPSKEPYMACQTRVTTLPSVACQASSHLASYRNDQLQQWGDMLPSINEGERLNDLFGQSDGHAHAMVSAAISKLSPGEDSLGNKGLGANINHEIMKGQGAAVMVEVDGSTSRNRTFVMGDNMSYDQGEKMVVSSTGTQAVGSSVRYASGSAEAGKVAASSTVFSPSYWEVGLTTGSGTPHEISAAQVHHIHAERKRRREQSDCIKTLGTLLPNITKKDKVSILESTIQHLKELKHRECELEQENLALLHTSVKQERKSQDSRQNRSLQENAIYYYGEDTMPYFQLNIIKDVQDVNVNTFVIEIMNALQERNLFCSEINLDFEKEWSKISIKITASHKDGGNYNPSLDDIQHINQWWKQRCA